MNQTCNLIMCLVVDIILAFSTADAQDLKPPPNFPFHNQTSREALIEKGIAVDSETLIKALKNSDPEIRGLAAMRLATNHVTFASKEIKHALEVESNTQTSVRMVGSLFQLAPAEGEPFVISLCQNVALSPIANISAARALTDLDPAKSAQSCAPAMEHIMVNKTSDPEDAAAALSVLTAVQTRLDEGTTSLIRKESLRFLLRKEFALRVAAIGWLCKDNSDEAQSALRQSMSTESNPAFRDMMRRSLESRQTR